MAIHYEFRLHRNTAPPSRDKILKCETEQYPVTLICGGLTEKLASGKFLPLLHPTRIYIMVAFFIVQRNKCHGFSFLDENMILHIPLIWQAGYTHGAFSISFFTYMLPLYKHSSDPTSSKSLNRHHRLLAVLSESYLPCMWHPNQNLVTRDADLQFLFHKTVKWCFR